MVITPWAGFTEILFNLAKHIKHTIMKHLSLLFSIFIIFFLSCSKNDDQDIEDFSKDSGTFIDERDGHEYKWIRIGEQIWMAENLAFLPDSDDQYIGSFYVYGCNHNCTFEDMKQSENFKTFGVLYTWEAIMQGTDYSSNNNPSGIRGISPKGWHIPSESEWRQLAQFIIDTKNLSQQINNDNELGKYLKAKEKWENNKNGSDDFGFNALPSGKGSQLDVGFWGHGLGDETYFWTSTLSAHRLYPYSIALIDEYDGLYFYKDAGTTLRIMQSLRCIKD